MQTKFPYFTLPECRPNFLNLTGALDCVNHAILLNKLHYYGIGGACHAWFESHLVNRKEMVCLLSNFCDHDTSSNWDMIVSGIPQGSILGPMLFILYVNDLPYELCHEDTSVMYADDTSVIITAKNETELKVKINPVLTSTMEWFSANGLVLNMEKKKYNEIYF
jgi:hypothetical protein